VVFMIEHNDDGALGVVLNQPTETRVDTVLDAWRRSPPRPQSRSSAVRCCNTTP
jgi:putative AlgH/UPF0301 family transcriptional regulator